MEDCFLVILYSDQINVIVFLRALSDMNSDGKMDKREFSIAMHLIKMKLQGYEVPKVLPTGLTAELGFGGMAGAIGAMGKYLRLQLSVAPV